MLGAHPADQMPTTAQTTPSCSLSSFTMDGKQSALEDEMHSCTHLFLQCSRAVRTGKGGNDSHTVPAATTHNRRGVRHNGTHSVRPIHIQAWQTAKERDASKPGSQSMLKGVRAAVYWITHLAPFSTRRATFMALALFKESTASYLQ